MNGMSPEITGSRWLWGLCSGLYPGGYLTRVPGQGGRRQPGTAASGMG